MGLNMAEISKAKHMITAFRVPQPGRGEEDLWLSPPKCHYVPWMCGGLGHLYKSQGKSTLQGNISCVTDKDGCFSPKETAPLLAKRYQFIEEIGRGVSAVVVKARDTFKRGDSFVAIKILNESFFDLGYQESNCVRRLNQADPRGFSGAIRLQNTFQFENHFCMVYEMLQPKPLHHFFRNVEQEQKLPLIRKVGIKLLQLLGFLQSQNVIHADLKPENILCDSNGLDGKIKVIDFGNAIHCVYDELALYYDDFELQTIMYRAPEVICGLPFGPEVDLWSVGCILAELYIGRPLFFARTKEDILNKIYQLLGPLPVNIYQRGKFYRSFDHLGGPPQPYIETFNKLRVVLGNSRCADMVSFILGFLHYDTGKRMTVKEAIQHPFLASEVAFGFFMQNEAVPCYSGGISISPTGYSHSLKMDKDLKAKKLDSLQLLRRGTNSKVTAERSARAIAQVPPFSRSSLVVEDKKSDTEIIREIPQMMHEDKTKEQECRRSDKRRTAKEELVPVQKAGVGIGTHGVNLGFTSEGDGVESGGFVTGLTSHLKQTKEAVTLKTGFIGESEKKVDTVFSKHERECKTKLTEGQNAAERELQEKKKQDFGTRRKRKSSLKEEDRNEMVIGVIEDGDTLDRRGGLREKGDGRGDDEKRLEREPSSVGKQHLLAKCDITSLTKSRQDGLEQRGIASGIVGHLGRSREQDMVKTNLVQNEWEEIVGVTYKKDEGKHKTDVRWSKGKFDGKNEMVDGLGGDVGKGVKFEPEPADAHTVDGGVDGISLMLDDVSGSGDLVTMEMPQPSARKTQVNERREQNSGSHGKRRRILKLEEKEKEEASEMRVFKEHGIERRNISCKRCSRGDKDSPEKEIASTSSKKRLAWQVYNQFEEDELKESPQKRRKSFARQLKFDEPSIITKKKIGKTYRLKKLDWLTQDLEKFLEETKGQPLQGSRRSGTVLSPCSLDQSVEGTGGKNDRRRKRRSKCAVETISEKEGRNTLNVKQTSKQNACAKRNRTRKRPQDKLGNKNGGHVERGKNSLEDGDIAVALPDRGRKGSVRKFVGEAKKDSKEEQTSKLRTKRKSVKTDLHPTNQNASSEATKTVHRKRRGSNFREKNGSKLKNVNLKDEKRVSPTGTEIFERGKIKDDMVDSYRERKEERVVQRIATKNYERNEGEREQQSDGEFQSSSFDSIVQITPGRGKKTLRGSTSKKQQKRKEPSLENQVDRGQQIKDSSVEDEEEDMVLLL